MKCGRELISANSSISYQETRELEQTDRPWLNWQGNGSTVQEGIYHNMRTLMNVMNEMSLEQMTIRDSGNISAH